MNKLLNNNTDKVPQINVEDVVGLKIDYDYSGNPTKDGWKSLTSLLQRYSDKRYETARYIFIKDGEIKRHIAVSSNTPDSTIIKPNDDFLYSLRTYAESNGSQIVFLHNHPSGYVAPSEADIELTSFLEKHFYDSEGKSRFSGHIILDHGNFGIYTPEEGWHALIDNSFEKLTKLNDSFSFENSRYGLKRIHGNSDLVLLSEKAKELDAGNSWNRDSWVPVWFATQTGTVRYFDYVNVKEFDFTEELAKKLRSIGRSNGSVSLYMIPSSKMQQLLCESFAQSTRMVNDVCFECPDGSFEFSQFSGGSLFNTLTSDDISVVDSNDSLDKKISVMQSNTNKGADIMASFSHDLDKEKDNKKSSDLVHPLNTDLIGEKYVPVSQDNKGVVIDEILSSNPANSDDFSQSGEIKSIKEEQSGNNTMENQLNILIEKIDSLMEENVALRRENTLLKDKVSTVEEPTMKESGDTMASSSEYEKSSFLEIKDFSRSTAFKVNTRVPRFGILEDNGEIKEYEGCRFCRLIENKENNSDNRVVLITQDKEGNNNELVVSEMFYQSIINNHEILEQKKSELVQDSFSWLKAHEEYNKNMHLDQDLFRLNIAANFRHNFRLRCRMFAHNSDEAMEQARILVEKMTKYERIKFNDMRRDYGSFEFDQDLLLDYNNYGKGQNISNLDFSIDPYGVDRALIEKNKKDLELPVGSSIANTSVKVGDTILMSIKTRDFKGIRRKTPKAEFQIVKVSKGFHPDKAIIYSAKTKSSYTVPLSSLETYVKKYEKQKKRDFRRSVEKDGKDYGFTSL